MENLEQLQDEKLQDEIMLEKEMIEQPQIKEELSIGQKLVGISFNPSGDLKVNRAKELCAELADIMMDAMNNREMTKIHKVLMDNTLCEILNAQMNVVKVLTFKY